MQNTKSVYQATDFKSVKRVVYSENFSSVWPATSNNVVTKRGTESDAAKRVTFIMTSDEVFRVSVPLIV